MKASCATSSISDGIADHARKQPLELALVFDHQHLEGLLVPALRSLDQLLVDFPVAHSALWARSCGGDARQTAGRGGRHERLPEPPEVV